VQHGELELPELQLIPIDQVAVGRAEELLCIGRVKCRLAADQLLEVVLAGHVSRVAVGGQDVADLEAFQLFGDLLDREPWVDDYSLLGARAGHYVAVDLTVELDLHDGELGHQSLSLGA